MRFIFFLCISLLFATSCREDRSILKKEIPIELQKQTIKYAKGFTISNHPTYKEIVVSSPWPKSVDTYRYILVEKGQTIPKIDNNDVVVTLPIKKLVVMSTTNIPSLEYLNVDDKLVGFPNTKYISSEKTRMRIENDEVKDLNSDLDINMELLLDLQPDLVIGFSVNGNNKTLDQIEKFRIPVVLDGAWTEQHPLGRAEWIKFIAAFFDKQNEKK